MRKFLLSIILLVLLFACSSEPTKYPNIDQDFCADIHLGHSIPLDSILSNYSNEILEKTGVLPLEEGDVSMIYRAWLSESAEKSIDIQYFIFSADNIGLIAADYLLRAADRGVKVRVLVDDIMVEADADDLLALNAHPNFSIKIYNPSANIGKNVPEKLWEMTRDFRGFNQRMHNKTFIVDGKVVITGGRNIADEYFDYDHEYNFRDRDVLLLGKAVNDVNKSFDLFWNSELSVPVSEIVNEEDYQLNIDVKYEYLHQYACSPENFWPQIREKIKVIPQLFKEFGTNGDLIWTKNVSFVSDVPGKNDGSDGLGGGGITTDTLISLIRNATKSVYIQSPYLITTELGQQLFKEAVERGVEVKILTNSLSSTDNLEAFNGYKRNRQDLLDAGIGVYEFKPDAAIRYEIMTGALQSTIDFVPIFGLHAKSMVVDGEVAVIGTFNLDPRSANLNTECVTVIRDEKVGFDLLNAIIADMRPENAWEITSDFNPDSEAGRMKQFKLWWRGIVPKSIL